MTEDIDTVPHMQRTWGNWWVIEKGDGYKVKRLEIYPNESVSMQYHNHRDELWNIVKGRAKVMIEGRMFEATSGDSFRINKKEIHKITCISKEPLLAIEVQIGNITNETDIVRV